MRSLILASLFVVPTAYAQPATKTDHPILAKVVTVGASLSDGFANGTPIARYLEKSIAVPHRRVGRNTSMMFFMTPWKTGKQQIDRTVRHKPSLVVGADFLFWYCYGRLGKLRRLTGANDEAGETDVRLRSLEKGLAQLERFDCRVVVGDLPDMTGADPRMLAASQVPGKEAQAILNKRIHAWAKDKPKVLLLPMAKWVREMRGGKMALERDGKHIAMSAKVVLSNDRLHPSKLGAVVFNHLLVKTLRTWLGRGYEKALAFDVWAVLEERGLADEIMPKKG